MADVRAPEVCPVCQGTAQVSRYVRQWDLFVVEACPGCRCPSCGKDSPGGVLHESCDWEREDYRHKVTEGSR